VAKGSDTPNKEIGIVLSRLSASLVGNHTCCPASQGGSQVAGGYFQVRRFDGGHRANHIRLLLCTETDHNDLIQTRHVWLHGNIKCFSSLAANFLRQKAHHRKYEYGVFSRDIEDVISVIV